MNWAGENRFSSTVHPITFSPVSSHTFSRHFILLEVIVLFNLLIVVHELGHFLAARWRGLVIEKFGIWFGKPLWKKTINGVQYSLGSIPFGGFVALPQLAPMESSRAKPTPIGPGFRAFPRSTRSSSRLPGRFSVSSWRSFSRASSGVVGHPVSEADMTTVIGYVDRIRLAKRPASAQATRFFRSMERR